MSSGDRSVRVKRFSWKPLRHPSYAYNPVAGLGHETPPEDAICVGCQKVPADRWYSVNLRVDFDRLGYLEPWCKRCVLADQLIKLREAAQDLPRLEAELAYLEASLA